MKNLIFFLSLLVSSSVSFTAIAEQEQPQFSEAQLAQMLAPIALYPDSLLTHILIAATYPIEIIEAHRWLKKNSNQNTAQQSKLLQDLKWDASVKALIPFEHILSRLSENLSWTQELGDAFLQDEARLLLSIQTLRKKAKLAGSLTKMANVAISYEDNNILILPREKEIVYVPYYDARMVYGSWLWSAYPPVYWHPYHSSYVSHHQPFYWHTGVHISFNYFFSAFHWHNRHVVVINPQHSRYHRPHRLIVSEGYAQRWSHQPAHRKGVAYRTKKTSEKYHSKRVGVHRNNKVLNTRHHTVKQSSPSNRQPSKQVKYQGKHDAMPSRSATKQAAQHHKTSNNSAGKHKGNFSKSNAQSARKQQHSVNKASRHNEAASHNKASTKRQQSHTAKERR